MLLLFETAAGYALFKVLKENKLQEVDVRINANLAPSISRLDVHTNMQDLHEDFSSLDRAQKVGCGAAVTSSKADGFRFGCRVLSSRLSASSRTQRRPSLPPLPSLTASWGKVTASELIDRIASSDFVRGGGTPLHAGLKKFLKKHAVDEELAVLDKKLGGIVQEKLGINCVYRYNHISISGAWGSSRSC